MKTRHKRLEDLVLKSERIMVIGRTICIATGTVILTMFFPPMFAVVLCLLVWRHRRPQRNSGTTHGTARWATTGELERAGCMFQETGGYIGKAITDRPFSIFRRWKALFGLPIRKSKLAMEIYSSGWKKPYPLVVRTPHASPHMFVFGASGSGKSTAFAVQMLLRSVYSMVVIDPKGELTRLTAKHRETKFGQTIYVIDPFGISRCGYEGQGLNPLDCFRDNELMIVDEARRLANALIVSRNENDRFWTDASVSVVTSIVAFLMAAGKKGASLNNLRDITSSPEMFAETLEYMSRCTACEGMLQRLSGEASGLEGKTKSSVLSTTNSNLSFLDSVLVSRVLESSTFDPRSILSGKATIYVCLPIDRLAEMAALQRVILTTLINMVFSAGEEQNREPIEFLIDEAAAIEEIPALYNAIQFGRSFGMRIRALYQSVSQLERAFPGSQKQDVLSTVSKIYAGSDDLTTAQEVSESMGTQTVLSLTQQSGANHGHTGSTGIHDQTTSKNWGSNDSTSYAEQSRSLMTPAEVLTLPRHLGIAILPGLHPVLFEKIPYYLEQRSRIFSLCFRLTGNAAVVLAEVVFLLLALWFFAAGQFDPDVEQVINRCRNFWQN